MDLNQHSGRPQPTNQYATTSAAGAHPQEAGHKKQKKPFKLLSLRGVTALLFLGVGIILFILLVYVVLGHINDESSYVNKSDYQVVFININGSSGGQAYFGNITSLTSKYIILDNAFYLQAGTSSNQFTLNNSSCALYNPQDQMIINRDQVAFWQNLKPGSAVTTDINKWYSEKLQCSKSSANSTGTSSTTGTSGATSAGTTGTSGTSGTTSTNP